MAAVYTLPILNGRGPLMAPTAKQTSDNWFQKEILTKLAEMKDSVDDSLAASRENGEAIRKLRVELGVDGAHGRLPQLEEQCARIDRRQEIDHKEVCRLISEAAAKAHADKNTIITLIGKEDKDLAARIDKLEDSEHEMTGGKKVLIFLGGFIGGSAGAAAIGIVAKMLGLIH